MRIVEAGSFSRAAHEPKIDVAMRLGNLAGSQTPVTNACGEITRPFIPASCSNSLSPVR
jgi:hypothetical protein